jgi:hypothetical protein
MPVFQSTFCVLSTSQVVGGFVPSATPDAFGPRNEGQFCALTVIEKTRMEGGEEEFFGVLMTTGGEFTNSDTSTTRSLGGR